MTGAGRTVLDQLTEGVVAAARRPPYLYEVGAADGRAALAEIQTGAADADDIDHRIARVPVGDADPVTVHLIRATDAPPSRAVVLYVHGGGWTMGGYRTHARFAQLLARGTGVSVAVPEYALAPEQRYPVALHQLAAVMRWLGDGAPAPLRADRLAVVGDCAGATLAAALVTRRLDPSTVPVRAMALLYPIAEPAGDDPAASDYAVGFGLRLADVRHLWRQYAPRPSTRAAPACDVLNHGPLHPARIPPTLIVSAEADVTRDRAEAFAARLRAAGAPVTAVRYLGAVHDFAVLDSLSEVPSTRAACAQVISFVRDAVGGPANPLRRR